MAGCHHKILVVVDELARRTLDFVMLVVAQMVGSWIIQVTVAQFSLLP